MKKILIKTALLIFVACVPLFAAEGKPMNEIRTYMPFTYPVDPARIQIIPDMDMSYGLAATLVEWDSEKQISAALAESWKIVSPNVYRFTLRKHSTWSNGKPVSSAEVKASFERGMKVYPDDLRSLAQILDTIECVSDHELDFTLKVGARDSGLLGKLTEPNYGTLKLNTDGTLDLSVTTGPFFLSPESNRQQLNLVRNAHWHHYDSSVPVTDRVIIRRSPPAMDAQTVLLTDKWPNLIGTLSLLKSDLTTRYSADHYEIWKRPIDTFFYFNLGKRAVNNDGRALIRYLRQTVDPKKIVAGFSGYTFETQMFPRGYQLHDPAFSYPKTAESLPATFKSKPLDILISTARVSPALKENIRAAILAATGIEPHFISIEHEQYGAYTARGDYDLYAGTVGLADPDPEGVMSFYLEGEAPMIPSAGNNFLARLDAARKEKNNDAKLAQMRSILSDALRDGYLLPLFHLSTIGIGRHELDFSHISNSDESVTLSRVRFRESK